MRQSLAAGSTSTYTYASAANQVASITNMVPPATATGTYLYNAFRQRVQKVTEKRRQVTYSVKRTSNGRSSPRP
jgi:hypothetical protein